MTLNTAIGRETTPPPLCVDLDGTLTRADLSLESLLRVLKQTPWLLFYLPLWFFHGKARLKAELARRASIDMSVLPYTDGVLDLIAEARRHGRPVILVTGSHEIFARQVDAHLQLFDEVIASTDSLNLTGKRKADKLVERFGLGGFDYVGNGRVDLPVWQAASTVIAANAPRHVVAKVASMEKPSIIIPGASVGIRTWLKAIRIHQWAKNFLIFVPLVTAHKIIEVQAVSATFIAFLAFGLCASATYIINDLTDLDADRHHPSKRRRPFAAGLISVPAGMVAAVLLLTLAFILALTLPVGFVIVLASYVVATLLYSIRLKRVASLDVLMLAGLYTVRIIAGAVAIGVNLSFWLLAFSMFIFLCLALVKRVAELIEYGRRIDQDHAKKSQLRGREYSVSDIPLLQMMGATSGYLAVLVLALYINSPEVSLLYRTPEILWLIAPLLLLWVTRLWIVTSRGYMDDDPLVFAIKDPETWVTGAITVVIIASATVMNLEGFI
ncbi:MAG: UbiA family prenyltransferase [Gammaproteobacteria bacterium]|nr:MAG: UbiA family prenyltransferase [Gammaproteobacteria bacterium]